MKYKNSFLKLFPEIEPYNIGKIKVSDLHTIYFEECGNPNGKPTLFIHGGPGAGITPKMRRFFDPSLYRIVLFDQRGCGRSTPQASLIENTTWHLVSDIEKLRTHLNISSWQIFGGSWGSTLALCYAQKYPNRVKEIILRGIFMLRKKEIDWFYQEGASFVFPDHWENFLAPIPPEEHHNLLSAYYKRLTSQNLEEQAVAAKAWSIWEGQCSYLYPNNITAVEYGKIDFALAFARIECHYFMNYGFFDRENQLIDNITKISHIPATIIQGRYDIVCPLQTSWELHCAWPQANFRIVSDAGHSAYEPGVVHELISATNFYAQK